MGENDGPRRYVLPEIDLSFDNDELEYLNRYFTNIERTCNHALNSYYGTMTPSGGGPNLLGMDVPGSIEATIERLVQRLVTSAGKLDARFASKFVLPTGSTYEHYKINRPDEYDFMIRLNQVSCPALDGSSQNPPCRILDDPETVPSGFARVQVNERSRPSLFKDWSEFMDADGCLLPHKIRQRFFELIRWVVKAIPVSMENVNECDLPGASGKVLDVGTLSDIFNIGSKQHVFIGIGDPEQDVFPEPRDFSIKVLQDGPAVRLEIYVPPTEELPESHNVSVDLTLSIGFVGWPTRSDFPDRIALSHVDAVNFYRASQKGFYVVGTGPHESIVCEAKDSLWRISNSTAEMELMTHYDHCSIPAKVMRITKIITGLLSDPSSFKDFGTDFDVLIPPSTSEPNSSPLHLISSYALKTLFLFELETYSDVGDWLESGVSVRVLSIVRSLLKALQRKHMRSYFFSELNVLLKKGLTLNLCTSDFNILTNCLRRMHGFSKQQTFQIGIDTNLESSIAFENDLASLWFCQIAKQKACIDKDDSEFNFTERQVTYLNLVFTEVLGFLDTRPMKTELIDRKSVRGVISSVDTVRTQGADRLLRLINFILEQIQMFSASQSLERTTCQSLQRAAVEELESHKGEKHWEPGKTAERLVCVLRTFVEEKKTPNKTQPCESTERLAAALTSYLRDLQAGSLENAWFVEDINERLLCKDLAHVTKFAHRVVTGECYAQQGLEEAVKRGEGWAIVLAEDLNVIGSIRLVFTPGGTRQITQFVHKFPFERHPGSGSSTPEADEAALLADLAWRFPAVAGGCQGPTARTIHCKLQTDNPLRAVLDTTRRYGHHRCPGSLLNGLIRTGQRTALDHIYRAHFSRENQGQTQNG